MRRLFELLPRFVDKDAPGFKVIASGHANFRNAWFQDAGLDWPDSSRRTAQAQTALTLGRFTDVSTPRSRLDRPCINLSPMLTRRHGFSAAAQV